MIRLLLLLALLAPAARAASLYPANWVPVPVSEFGGLNLLNDSTAIGSDAQVAQNVLTDNGYLEKRQGNVILGTILAGYPVKFFSDWVAPNGTRFVIAHASNTVYRTDFSGDPVALSTTQPLFSISAQPAFGRLFFADGYRAPWYWDGSSTSTVVSSAGTAAPICTYLAFKDSRIFCANIPDQGTSRVRISSTGGAGYWVVPADVSDVDNAPNVFDFTPDDGDSIKCMQTTPWGVFVGKQYSSWMIKGTGNLSYELRILDPKVGCKDNRSVQMVYGVLTWLSNDGVYAFDGSGPPRLISRELDPLVADLPYTSFGTKFWLTNTKSDWEGGNLTASGPGAPISSTLLSGSITVSSVTLTENTTTLFALGTCDGCGVSNAGDVQFSGVTSTYVFRAEHNTILPLNEGWANTNATSIQDVGGSSLTYTCPSTSGGFCYTSRTTGATANDNQILVFRLAAKAGSERAGYVGFTYGNNSPVELAAVHVTSSDISYAIRDSVGFRFLLTETQAQPSFSTYTIIVSTNLGAHFYRDGIFKASGTISYGGNRPNYIVIGAQGHPLTTTIHSDFIYYSTSIPRPTTTADLVGISTYTSRIFDTQVSTPTFGLFTVSSTVASPTVLSYSIRTSTSPNNDMWESYRSFAGGSQPPGGISRYAQYRSTFSHFSLVESPGFISVVLDAATTGYYHSAVHLIGSAISTYGIFTVTQDVPDGSIVIYSVRATTYSFTDISGVNIPWTAQTANQTVGLAVSTPTYFQFRSLINFNYPANIPSISRIQLNWNEGTGKAVSSGSLDRRYYLCITVSSAAVTPDTCLIKQKNGKWVTWTGPSVGAMGLYNYTLIAADAGTSSELWTIMVPGEYSDDGVAIDSQWVSADYTNGIIFNDKILHEFWVDALPVVASSVTLSYAVNKSSAYTDYQFYLDNGQPVNNDIRPKGFAQHGQLNQWVPLFSGFDVGKYIRVKFADAQLGTYWRINAYMLYLENKSRQPPN